MSKTATYFKISSVQETTSYFKYIREQRSEGGEGGGGRDTHTKANFLNDNILHRLITSTLRNKMGRLNSLENFPLIKQFTEFSFLFLNVLIRNGA